MSSGIPSLTAQGAMAADPKGLEALRRLNGQDAKEGAKAVAKQFEALLMQQMLNSMRQANQSFGEESGGASGMFRSMQDQQWAQISAMKGGLGLTDAIVRQINQQREGYTPLKTSKPAATTQADSAPVAAPIAAAAAKPAAGSASAAESFIGKLAKVAENAATKLGLSPSLVVAHAALETGWGNRAIKTADGQDSHNLFGIKAGRDWTGKTADVTTTEFVDGKAQKRVEKFRAYGSDADALSDYASLLQRRFASAVGQGSNAAGFGKALQNGGYATDPDYASKIAQVAQNVAARLAARQAESSAKA